MNQDTTIANVKAQLMYEWDEEENDNGEIVEVKGNQLMTEAEASALIEKHKDVFESSVRMGSYAYYTANQIRSAEAKQ